MRIAVIGLGRIGLPLAVQFAGRGHRVLGYDSSADRRREILAGQAGVTDESAVTAALPRLLGEGLLELPDSVSEAVAGSTHVIVAVPLGIDPADLEPDFHCLDEAARGIGNSLSPGTLVVCETTVPVGTTRKRIKPLLESTSGMTESADFYLAFSPERVLAGRVLADLRAYPKLVGALSSEGTERAVVFYSEVLDFEPRPDLPRGNGVWAQASAEAAEFAKLAEVVYRDVNIALANQLSVRAGREGIDFREIIEACNSQPHSHLHAPGISVGGHCIPVYPHLYLAGDPAATLVSEARAVNDAMPLHAATVLESNLGGLQDKLILIYGITYRSGIKQVSHSGVFHLVEALEQQGARTFVCDPLVPDDEIRSFGLAPYVPGSTIDALVVHTDHPDLGGRSCSDFPGVRVVLDGRGATVQEQWRGARYVTL